MPETTALAPFTHPTTGEPVAAGATVKLNDEDYAALRASGTVAASEEEVKAHATAEAEGNYTERTGREQAGGQPEEKRAPPSTPPPPGAARPK